MVKRHSADKGISTMLMIGIVIIVVIIAIAGFYLYQTYYTAPAQNTTLPTATITAGGASFPYPLITQWTYAFAQINPQAQITYQSVGSGTGQKNLFNMTYDFAGSDAPLTAAQIASNPGILEIPETCGGVTIAYNIPGIPSGLNLTANVIAEIFQQNITKWNDPQITGLNPGFNLPNVTIVPVHRQDASGTTNIFSSYLANASAMWVLGRGTTVPWPAGQLNGPQNSGVASILNVTQYSVGYIEYFYAASNGITFANVQDHDGQFVTPSLSTISADVNQGAPLLQQNIANLVVNQPGNNLYPISSFTYLMVRQNMTYLGQAKAIDIASFLWWAVHNGGQQYANGLYYPQLPDSIVTIDENLINSLTYNNAPVAFIKQ